MCSCNLGVLFYYQLKEDDPILNQVALTSEEIKTMFTLIPDISVIRSSDAECSTSPSVSTKLTEVEKRAIFEAKDAKAVLQVWKLNQLIVRKNAKCCNCKSTMPPGKFCVEVNGW